MLCWCWRLRSGAAEAMKQGLSFERGFLCPAGTEAFFICCLGRLRRGQGHRGHAQRALQKKLSKACTLRVVFCALRARRPFFICCLGRLRGVRQGGAGYGAAPPSRPPLHPPRSTPLELSNFRHYARAARLSLRELPRCARRSPCAPRNASVRFRVG